MHRTSSKLTFIIFLSIFTANLIVSAAPVKKSPPHCGIAAINAILDYTAVYTDRVDFLPDDYCSSSTALSLFDLKNILKQKGIDSSGFRLSINELNKEYLPAIAHLENHFIAILDCTDSHLLISDMNRKPVIITKAKFASSWTGNILSIKTDINLFSGNKVEVRVNAEKNNPWSPMKVNPGYIESKSPIKINWMIHNETNKHLSSSSVESTCNCIELSPKELSLEKNDSQILTTVFRSPSETAFSENTVYIFWKDKNIEPIELSMTSFYICKFRFNNRFVGFLNGFCGSTIEREISFVNEGFDPQEIDFTTTGPIIIKDISFYDPDSSVTSGVITLCINLPDKPIGFTYYLGAHDISNDNIWDRVIFSGESKPIFQLQPPFLYWDPVKDKLAPKSCTLTPLTGEAISSVKIGENELDYNTTIKKIDNKKWEIHASPKPDGKNLTGKIEIWINKLSYPLYLRMIGKGVKN